MAVHTYYFETCLQCGDDIWTLARSLRLDTASITLPTDAVHLHKNGAQEQSAGLHRCG